MQNYYFERTQETLETLRHHATMARYEAEYELLDRFWKDIKGYWNIHGKVEIDDVERLIDIYQERIYSNMESEGDNYSRRTSK